MPASFKAFLMPLLLLPYSLVYLVTPKSASGQGAATVAVAGRRADCRC